ncbi:hypothetical protein [Gilliamella apis]|uniref:Uncharacterized protein n=1 Tax=Gilliamella apis TaxID=1970738 RepID=A0A2V4DP15_9GAMM|nr:hypothetical protein [Gilliamella apis]PXY91875.1 hypothetical protein DKK78_06060 [Gilliamella apis]WLS93114.1 hypothetical protein RAM17_07610 [Gilliamella apis]
MNIKINDKLEISQRQGFLSLIDEGSFLRIYNQSAFIITQILQHNFKISAHTIGKFQQYHFVYCAFPKRNLHFHFENIRKTAWGYELTGEYDLVDYDNWFKQFFVHTHKNLNRNITAQQLDSHLTSGHLFSNERSVEIEGKPIYLNPKQIMFLRNWQRGYNNNIVIENFIESLQRKLR